MPTGNLPKHAKEIFNAAEASALKGSCKNEGDRKRECAARIGWAAVKKVYKKEGDKWVKKSEAELLEVKAMDLDYAKWEQQLVSRKYTQEEAGFRSGAGIPSMQCGDCQHFIHGNACSLVDGTINPGDICNFFEQETAYGDMPSSLAKSEFDMVITKASYDKKTGQKRWAAVASDTEIDAYKDRMSIALFSDFIRRIDDDEPVPIILQSEAWQGGLPYLGISHYLDLDGYGIAGDTAAIYVDGSRLKAKGLFKETPIGQAAYTAIKSDIVNETPYGQRVRISIFFVDWQHVHGEYVFTRRSLSDVCSMCSAGVGDKIYTKGQLIHLALTRVPVNKRTPIWIEEKAHMTTMREDALSILKDESLVDELERREKEKAKSRVGKAGLAEVDPAAVVVRADDEPMTTGIHGAETMKSYGGATTLADAEAYLKEQDKLYEIMDHWSVLQGVLDNIYWNEEIKDKPQAIANVIGEFKGRVDEAVKRSLAIRAAHEILESEKESDDVTKQTETPAPAPAPVEQPKPVVAPAAPTPLAAAFAQLSAVVTEARSLPKETRYLKVQDALNVMASAIKSEIDGTPMPDGADLDARIQKHLTAAIQPLVDQMAILAAKSYADPSSRPSIPAPRAFQPGAVISKAEGEVKPISPLTKRIRQSVGLRE